MDKVTVSDFHIVVNPVLYGPNVAISVVAKTRDGQEIRTSIMVKQKDWLFSADYENYCNSILEFAARITAEQR